MDLPAVSLLLLEQGDRFLKDHTRKLLDLAFLIYFPNSPAMRFLQHQPKKACKGTPAHGRSTGEFCLICRMGMVIVDGHSPSEGCGVQLQPQTMPRAKPAFSHAHNGTKARAHHRHRARAHHEVRAREFIRGQFNP